MKQLKDIKEGDFIWVKCPKEGGEWRQEKVTEVKVGEDGYKGSGQWFRWIMTNYSVESCPDELCNQGKHWGILSPVRIYQGQSEYEYIFDANSHIKAKLKLL